MQMRDVAARHPRRHVLDQQHRNAVLLDQLAGQRAAELPLPVQPRRSPGQGDIGEQRLAIGRVLGIDRLEQGTRVAEPIVGTGGQQDFRAVRGDAPAGRVPRSRRQLHPGEAGGAVGVALVQRPQRADHATGAATPGRLADQREVAVRVGGIVGLVLIERARLRHHRASQASSRAPISRAARAMPISRPASET